MPGNDGKEAQKAAAVPTEEKKPDKPLDKKAMEIERLKKEINAERKKRASIIYKIKGNADRLAYKMSEKSAIAQLAQISHVRTKDIGFLKRRKEQLEFRISTEAFSLEAEKDLIRKKSQVQKELDEALASYKLKKKSEYLEKDIAQLTKEIEELNNGIKESDKKLDVLYSDLRRIIGEDNRKARQEKKQREPTKAVEISLADIAIIKDKKEEKGQNLDDAVVN
ncbi:MAG: hypothetical protein KGH72_03465 [Candidatus Micrarchaeota archaeon]|nr:hypothetical protein [Candidatus Micrarchaeota archaeon]